MLTSYPKADYDLVDIRLSTRKNKKYDAYIRNRYNGNVVKISFGYAPMPHYKDSTPLKFYSHLDHNDEARRVRYQQRFRSRYDPRYYSSTYFSWNYLW